MGQAYIYYENIRAHPSTQSFVIPLVLYASCIPPPPPPSPKNFSQSESEVNKSWITSFLLLEDHFLSMLLEMGGCL